MAGWRAPALDRAPFDHRERAAAPLSGLDRRVQGGRPPDRGVRTGSPAGVPRNSRQRAGRGAGGLRGERGAGCGGHRGAASPGALLPRGLRHVEPAADAPDVREHPGVLHGAPDPGRGRAHQRAGVAVPRRDPVRGEPEPQGGRGEARRLRVVPAADDAESSRPGGFTGVGAEEAAGTAPVLRAVPGLRPGRGGLRRRGHAGAGRRDLGRTAGRCGVRCDRHRLGALPAGDPPALDRGTPPPAVARVAARADAGTAVPGPGRAGGVRPGGHGSAREPDPAVPVAAGRRARRDGSATGVDQDPGAAPPLPRCRAAGPQRVHPQLPAATQGHVC